MLTINIQGKKNADQTLIRSARSLHSKTLKISIRARGDTQGKHKKAVLAIDKFIEQDYSCVLERYAIVCCFMNEFETLVAVEEHRNRCTGSLQWFAGVHFAPRIHPWDEQELSFPTMAWIEVEADSPVEAQRAAEALFARGFGVSPVHTNAPSASHVFAYVLHPVSNN